MCKKCWAAEDIFWKRSKEEDRDYSKKVTTITRIYNRKMGLIRSSHKAAKEKIRQDYNEQLADNHRDADNGTN